MPRESIMLNPFRNCRSFLACAILAVGASVARADMPQAPALKAEPPKSALRGLSVFPEKIELSGPRAEQPLGVLGDYADGRQWDLSRAASFKVESEKIATVTAGVLRPVADGETNVVISVGLQSVKVPVTVKDSGKDVPVSFAREIVPVLTRMGCNQGACHGAALGRGGFRLSLRGFDPSFDHPQIVQSAEGRRIVLSDPERSILLMKPAGQMEHQGGERFAVGSREYNLIKQWLQDGVPEPVAREATVTSLQVWPPKRLMALREQQQILVRAVWSDGLVTDVTPMVQFDAINEGVAAVSPAGLITAKGPGESHVMLRYQGQATIATVTLPYGQLPPGTTIPTSNFIDEKLAARWKALGLTPSALCSDEEFLRRLSLDAIGTLPTPAEVKAFLADKSPDKRTKVIDAMLERPEFVDFWALKWGDLLRINRDLLQDKGMWCFHNWVRASLRDNKPVDEMVREIITAEGSPFMDGPANYYMAARTPPDWAETTAQLFLGVRMQCAKCHQHPFEKWTQDDYAGLAAFFARMGTKNSQEYGLFGRETVIFLKTTGEQTHPRKGNVVKPHPLDGPDMDDPLDRRRKLADWLTAKDNRFFARNIVNRFWAYTMGRGLVEPVDDMRATNPPSNPELLDALAADFAGHNFDLKHLLRTIFQSRAYQLSAVATAGNKMDASNIQHTRYQPKRLTAEQLADALDFATGTREKYVGLPLGTRAIQLPDTKVRSFLMDTFGRPPRQVTCECERTTQPNIAQAMHLLNGDFLNKKIEAPTGRIETLLKAKATTDALIDELYLSTLSRLPTSDERTWAKGWVGRAPNVKEGACDLLSVLLNSREFLFNH
jgi:hypothetical protein